MTEALNLVLAQPRGFCAGVRRAIEIVELALETYAPPIYVFHEIVHNRHVVESLRTRGAVFVEDLAEVPAGRTCIFSAHGVSSHIVAQAEARGLHVLDATCPLVTKVHMQAQRYVQQGYELIIIGHRGHPEVEGTRGRVAGNVHVLCSAAEAGTLQVERPQQLAYVTQTTLSLDDTRAVIAALQHRFPSLQGPDVKDICYATQNRQNAVRELSREIDLLLVVGAHNSSNSNRLRELGEQMGVTAYLIESADDIEAAWLESNPQVGITAGASAPEVLIEEVVARLRSLGAGDVREMDGVRENITFRLPVELLHRSRTQTQ